MNSDILFQIAAVGIIVAVLNQLLAKTDHGEHALMITIAGLVMVMIMIIGEVGRLFDTIRLTFRI